MGAQGRRGLAHALPGGPSHQGPGPAPPAVDRVEEAIEEIRALGGVSSRDPFQFDIRLYPLVDQIADKVAAMYEMHGERSSSRYRDLVDLVIITRSRESQSQLDRGQLERALLREEGRRSGLELPRAMQDPGPGWADGYRRAAQDAGVTPTDLEAALDQVGAVVNPALTR